MPHLQSVAIEFVRYDDRARKLAVTFRASGRVLVYEGVPQQTYDSLLFADSISGYFRRHIAGVYPARDASPRREVETIPPGSVKGAGLERDVSAAKTKKGRRR
jgi:hypothetical protein